MKKQSIKSFETQTNILTLDQQKQVKGGEDTGIRNANSGRSNNDR